jgi:hypothetical protein
MSQLLLHLIGDYVLQSDHMGARKRSSTLWASFHAIVYALPFLLLRPSWPAWSVICGSHLVIDRFGLARYVVWAKNVVLGLWPERILRHFGPRDVPAQAGEDARLRLAWKSCAATGYPADVPSSMATMLLIVVDNTMHLAINWASLTWL